jgi:FtsP/CotA-like multicopper oxidase with cupredoxin domain
MSIYPELHGRRDFLKGGAASLTVLAGGRHGWAAGTPADHTLRIATGLVELGPDTIVSTKLYNGHFPGPLLRMQEGRPVTIDVYNDTDTPELLHLHGLFLPPVLDGAMEEGTPFIPPHGYRRFSFVPAPAGFRFYHTHTMAGADLTRGLYSGLAGPIYIQPGREPGAYDREVFLTLKEFDPFFTRMEMPADFLEPNTEVGALRDQNAASVAAAIKAGQPEQGFELAYNVFSINGKMLGAGEPVRVKQGERVLFHILNASATEIRSLALPGHSFRVVALDGNPVPNPADVPVLWIGTAERISAIVEMKSPGVWVMGDLDGDARGKGMGIVVEYAGGSGKPVWSDPAPSRWNYARFGAAHASVAAPDETIEMIFSSSSGAAGGFDRFAINGVSFSMDRMDPLFRLKRGRRYRLRMRNATDDVHPMHLHRHSFMLTKLAGLPTAGVMKDVVMVGKYQEIEVDFTADQPGLSLFHCHMQQHMDFGLMCLFDCV